MRSDESEADEPQRHWSFAAEGRCVTGKLRAIRRFRQVGLDSAPASPEPLGQPEAGGLAVLLAWVRPDAGIMSLITEKGGILNSRR